MYFVSRERYGRASGRFRGAVGYKGEEELQVEGPSVNEVS
jgi:hypothetical protein